MKQKIDSKKKITSIGRINPNPAVDLESAQMVVSITKPNIKTV